MKKGKRITINEEDASAFVVPPKNQGQTVEISFALVLRGAYAGGVLRRWYDKSDGEERITLHRYEGKYDPWVFAPPVGKRGGKAVTVVRFA